MFELWQAIITLISYVVAFAAVTVAVAAVLVVYVLRNHTGGSRDG